MADDAAVADDDAVDVAVGVPGPLQATRISSARSMTEQRIIILLANRRTGRSVRSVIGDVLPWRGVRGMKKDGSGALFGAGCVAGGCGFLFFRSTVTSDRPRSRLRVVLATSLNPI
jgi:hypothetical protein